VPTETSDSDLGFVAQDDDIGFKPEPAGDGIGFRPADDGADLGFREEAQSTPLLEKPAALANALVTGVKQALVNIDVLQANRLGSAAPPSYRSQRAAFESAAADPRGMATSRVDPLSGELNLGAGEGLFGPAAKLEEIQRPAQLEREATQFDVARGLEGLRSRPVSPTMQRFNAVPNNDVLGLAREVARNPVEVLGSIALQSLPASLMGLPAGPAGIGASSAATEFANTLVDQAGEMGFDLTDPRDVARFFADPRALSRAREAAALRAIPIGVFDAMTARLAGRWMEPAMGKGAKAVVGAGAKELAMQMAGGAAGEAAGQAMSGQDWSAKDIIMEALGELGGAPFEIASNLSEDKAHRSPGASAGPSNRIEVQAEPTPATVEAGPVGDDISFAPDEPAKSAGPADGGSGVLDTVDWADVGRVPVHRAMEEETVDGFVSRRSAMQKVAGRANAWGVEDPDVRWAPELRAPGGGMVEAWVDPGTGRVVLNAAAPRLQDDSSAGPIVREEIAHQQLMSDEGVAAVREFASQFLTPDVVAQIEGAGYVRPEGWSDRRWMDYLSNEFIAKAAAKDTPFWKEIVERVKVWVHQVTGGRVSLTSEEAARALMRSVRAGRRGSEVSAAGLQEAPQASVRKQAFPQLSLGLDVLDGKERLPEGVKPKIINIAEWFQSRVPEADRINHKTATPEQNRRLVDELEAHVRYALALHPEAAGWYDENVARVTAILREIDPDLAKPDVDFIFRSVLAVTSDGNEVGSQFANTWEIYSQWKQTGRIDPGLAKGKSKKNIGGNLELIQAMVDHMGASAAKDWLSRKGSLKEIRAAARRDLGFTLQEASKIGGDERVDQVLPYAVVFGPKLGSFFNNLYGDFSTTTMDRWFMRTMGRLTGTQVDTNVAGELKQGAARVRKALASLSKEDRARLKGKVTNDSFVGDALMETAQRLNGFFQVAANRVGGEAWDEFRRAVNYVAKLAEPLVESPENGGHRAWIRDRMDDVSRRLAAGGIELNAADTQALLWYLEKELYEKLGYQSRSAASDYAAAAEQLHERLVGRPSRIAADAAGRVGRIGRSRDQQPGGSPVGAPVEGAALPQLSVEGPPEGDATRRFARQIDASSDISGEVRDQTNPKAFYTPRRNETDAAFASRIVDQVGGPEAAIAVFRDRQSGLPEAVRGFVAQSIIKKLGELEQVAALSDAARSSQLAGIAARFITDDVFPATTSAGQFVQSFAAFSRLTPAGMIGVYRLTMNRVSGNVRDRLSGTVERIAKGLRKVNADGIGELAGDRAAQQAATSAIDASVPSSPAVRQAIVVQVAGGIGASPVVMRQAALAVQRAFQAPAAKAAASGTLWSRYVAEAVNSLASSADAGGGRGAKALVGELTDAIVSTLREQVQRQFPKHEPGSPPSGLTPVQRMASVLANPGPAREIWLRTVMALRERFPNDPRVEALSLEPAALFSRDIVRAAVKAELEGFGLSVRDIVAGHYTLLNEGQTLADRLASGTGIATVHAQELARVIDELFRSESAKLKAAVPAKVKDQRSRLKRAAQSGVVDMASVPIDEVDQAIRSELTRMRTSVSQVLKDHYTTLEGTGRTLAEGFVAGAGLNAEVAKHLAGVIQSRFRSLLADRRRAEIIRHADAAPRAYRKRMPIEELAQLAALGILNEEQVWNAMREKLALPGFDPRVAGDITRMANALQKLPEGVRRDEAAIDIMRFIARQRGQRASDLPVAFWYANMLSGTLTHLINSVSNATQIVAHATTAAARRPGSVPLLLEATVDGVLGGINEAARVMQTGKVTGARAGIKLGPGNALETLGTDAAWKRLVEKWKYVSRALGAADMLFYRTAEAQRVAVLGKAVAAEEGLTGAAAETRAREILYGTEDLRAQAAERVALEGLTGTLAEKRRRELVAAGRPGQINENAHAYALRVVFNDQPYGVLGIVGSSIKYLAARLPATRLLVPFVDVVCNVTNEALNYTPVGLVRGAQGRWLGEMNGRQIDLATEAGRQDLFDQWSKAAVGTGAVLGLALMASGDLDKEDPDFAIYGAGPGDQAKTQLLRARGWRPWSVKVGEHYVPYADTPLAIGLAVAGSYMDALRWQKMDQASALDRVAIALMAAPRVTVQKSFLRGLSDFFVALSRQSSPAKAGEKGMQVAAGVASGFVVPNLLREVDRVFDPTVTDNRSVEGLLANQIPFVRRLGRPALTPLGDPVQANPLDRLWSNSTRDRLVRLLADKGAWVSLPDQGDLTDDEYYDVVKARGEMLRPMLESMEPTLDAADRDLARRIVSRISEATSKAARAEVLSKRPQ